jgi:hypothetical protein
VPFRPSRKHHKVAKIIVRKTFLFKQQKDWGLIEFSSEWRSALAACGAILSLVPQRNLLLFAADDVFLRALAAEGEDRHVEVCG